MNDTDSLDDAFSRLQRFLNTFDQPALAHAREELTPLQEAEIASFARGELQGESRESLMQLLSRNTTALEHLAGLLRSPRRSQGMA